MASLDTSICPRCEEPMAAFIGHGSSPRYLCRFCGDLDIPRAAPAPVLPAGTAGAGLRRITVDGRGRLIADSSIEEVLERAGARVVRVRTTDPGALGHALSRIATTVERLDEDGLIVTGASVQDIGAAAREVNLTVHELTEVSTSLEQAYLELTGSSVEYAAPSEDG